MEGLIEAGAMCFGPRMSRTCGHSAVVLQDPEGNEVCVVQEWFGRAARSHPVICLWPEGHCEC
ncbi:MULTISPECIES: hypothetical protein [unclassified Streptomyces]|uniref:hypothetical protein n=1 Tax=unclassified Streptomyces TaxID=2593676 RepID=UPI0033F96F7F